MCVWYILLLYNNYSVYCIDYSLRILYFLITFSNIECFMHKIVCLGVVFVNILSCRHVFFPNHVFTNQHNIVQCNIVNHAHHIIHYTIKQKY